MILISTGTLHYPFTRLLDFCFNYFPHQSRIREKIIVQTRTAQGLTGSSQLEIVPFLPLAKMIKYYQTANLIISAAGEGSVSLMLHYARFQPVLFPRQQKFGEHVDDQQVKIAQTLAEKKAVTAVYNVAELEQVLDRYRPGQWLPTKPREITVVNSKVIQYLHQAVEQK